MAKNSYYYISKSKIYYIILLGNIFGSFFFLNISKSNSKLRKLETTLCCYYSSGELLNHYKTGDLSEIDLSDDHGCVPNLGPEVASAPVWPRILQATYLNKKILNKI